MGGAKSEVEEMTNGEKIMQAFPNYKVQHSSGQVVLYYEHTKEYSGSRINFDEEWWNAEYNEPTTKNDLAQERYQDLIEYFGDEKVVKTILEDRKEFKAWLERLRWNVKRVDELARELEHIKSTTKNDLGVNSLFVEFKEKLSKWMYHNSESVCGDSMIDIDYLEGHINEILYEMGIIGEAKE